MEPTDLLRQVTNVLERLSVDYAVVGSIASPEDVMLKKMEFYREGGSEKHLRDITGILKIRGDRIDRHYISDWVDKLNVADIWKMILSRVDEQR